jgi:hypothetical protein
LIIKIETKIPRIKNKNCCLKNTAIPIKKIAVIFLYAKYAPAIAAMDTIA